MKSLFHDLQRNSGYSQCKVLFDTNLVLNPHYSHPREPMCLQHFEVNTRNLTSNAVFTEEDTASSLNLHASTLNHQSWILVAANMSISTVTIPVSTCHLCKRQEYWDKAHGNIVVRNLCKCSGNFACIELTAYINQVTSQSATTVTDFNDIHSR